MIFQLNITPEIIEDFLIQSDTWLAFTVILGVLFLVIICLFIFLRKVAQSLEFCNFDYKVFPLAENTDRHCTD